MCYWKHKKNCYEKNNMITIDMVYLTCKDSSNTSNTYITIHVSENQLTVLTL